jgi:peptide/nickel transport system permease protein
MTRRRGAGTRASRLRPHGMAGFVLVRLALAVGRLVVISVIVFAATQLLPGNAARAKLGKQATKASVAALPKQVGLDRSPLEQYGRFIGGLLRGHPGNSLTSGQPIMADLAPRLQNSAFQVLVAAVISIPRTDR